MKVKEYAIVPWFERFIKESFNGKRLKPDGTLLKKASVRNYTYVLQYLKTYEQIHQTTLRVKAYPGKNTRLFREEKKILGYLLPGIYQIPV